MYICICNAVTEREIRECASLGACSLRDLEQCLGVGTTCGRCRQSAQAVLENEKASDSMPQLIVQPA